MFRITSTQFSIVERIYRSLVVRIKDVRLIASAGPSLHRRIEASRLLEASLEAPSTAGCPDAVAARDLVRARVLGQQLFRSLAEPHTQHARQKA